MTTTMTTTMTPWTYIPTKFSNLKEGDRVKITEKFDGRYVGKLIVRRVTKSGKLIFWALNRSGKRSWSLSVIPSHESRHYNGSEWNVEILTPPAADLLDVDKKAVAQSLAKSAGFSSVKIPSGFDFDFEFLKLEAQMRGRYSPVRIPALA